MRLNRKGLQTFSQLVKYALTNLSAHSVASVENWIQLLLYEMYMSGM